MYRVSDIVGDWKSYSASFTITGNGWIYLTTNSGTSETYISGWDINGEILEGEELLKIFLTVTLTDGGIATLTLTFNSASNCTATLQGTMLTFTKL